MGGHAKEGMNPHYLPAHQLIDFDWKLKYAVSSSSLATMMKPLLRLELCISNTPQVINNPNSIPDHQPAVENPLVLISEYSKVELDNLISELETIQKVPLDGTVYRSGTGSHSELDFDLVLGG